MNFNNAICKKEYFRHVVLKKFEKWSMNSTNCLCQFLTRDIGLQSKLQTIKAIVSVNMEGYDCSII